MCFHTRAAGNDAHYLSPVATARLKLLGPSRLSLRSGVRQGHRLGEETRCQGRWSRVRLCSVRVPDAETRG